MKLYNKTVIYTFAILLITILPLTGCWDNKDINHRLLPVVLGVSKIENEYEVIINLPVSNAGKIESRIVSFKDKTIAKAIDTISRNLESRVDLLHVKLIIIERGAAEDGVKDIIGGFMRSREVSPKALVAICDEDINVLFSKLKDTIGSIGSTTVDFFEKNAGWDPDIALTRVWEVYRGIHSYTYDVAIPLIRSGDEFPMEQIGSAIVKNGKMVDQISPDETLLYNIFKGESSSGEIEVMEKATVRIVNNSIHHKGSMHNNQPFLKSKIKLKVVILETRGEPSLNEIKRELNQALSERFNNMISKTKENKADIFGIGQFFRRELTRKELKNWRTKYYTNLKMDIQFNVDIQNQGYLITS
ncbi:Ger(x)C family spore germination protein [Fredinandcohnia sp. FSL W7-1320]|uniref:Ger(x)C family spore germination protein n=1 Tax=Fredinandcohnia sp. FSL W7-1320 TaxID=2954540 RepID=UPI000EB160FE